MYLAAGVTSLVVSPLLLWYWYWCKDSRLRSLIGKFPGPRCIPIYGNALELGVSTSDFMIAIERLCTKFRRSAYRLWIGPSKVIVFLSTPNDAQVVLESKDLLEKAENYNYLLPWFGPALLTGGGLQLKRTPKAIAPTLTTKMLEDFADVFHVYGEVLVDQLRKEVNGPGFDVHGYSALYALDVIAKAVMGINIHAQTDTDSDYVTAVHEQADILIKRATFPWLSLDFIFHFSKYQSVYENYTYVLKTVTNNIIRRRRGEIADRTKLPAVKIGPADNGLMKTYTDLVIETVYKDALLTEDDIRDLIDNFMFEGRHTMASALSFTLWLLSRNQDIQEKVFNEVRFVCSDLDDTLTYHGLQELRYLERVVQESLRLFPSIPLITRHLGEDVELKDGRVLPKGATVSIVSFMLHRNPDVFPDPLVFDPDRFLPDNVQGRHPYAYLPFSAGSRNCIGEQFAVLELKSAVAHVLKHFRLLPATDKPDLVLANELSLISKTGVQLKLTARD